MRRILAILVAALGLVLNNRAGVLIYEGRTTAKVFRPGLEHTISTKEYFVWNLVSNRVILVIFSTLGGQKLFSVSAGKMDVTQVPGDNGRSYTILSAIGQTNGIFDTTIFRRQVTVLKHQSNAAIYFPRTFKGIGRTLNTEAGPRFSESTHSYVISPKRTIGANDLGLTEEQAVANLLSELQSKGYRRYSRISLPDATMLDDSSISITNPGALAKP